MPLYIFQHPETMEEVEIVQPMKDEHVYIDDAGTQWNRIFFATNASFDTKGDCFSREDFARQTAKQGMTVDDMWNLSKEMSHKREKVVGDDPVKKKYFKDYEKKRKGVKHGNDPKKKGIGPMQF